MSGEFNIQALLEALDTIGRSSLENGARLELNIYGGAALMLAGNFRFSTEDVDIAPLGETWPDWLNAIVKEIAARNGWAEDWLNDAVAFHLSRHAGPQDHLLLGTFPRNSDVGLNVNVPTAEYMLALKLKAMRVNDPAKAATETSDILALLAACGVTGVDDAIDILAKFFPVSAQAAEKQRFVLKHIMQTPAGTTSTENAPSYPAKCLGKNDGWDQ